MLLKVHDICVIRLYLLFYFPICLLTWMNCTPWGSWFPLINGFLSIWGSDVFYLLVTVYIQVPWIHLCREDLCLMDVLLCVIFFLFTLFVKNQVLNNNISSSNRWLTDWLIIIIEVFLLMLSFVFQHVSVFASNLVKLRRLF